MTIDEAIKHCEEVAEENTKACDRNICFQNEYNNIECEECYIEGCNKCASEHRQLAEWLRELKVYKGLNTYNRPNKCSECEYEDSEYYCDDCIWNFVDKFKQREVNADDSN